MDLNEKEWFIESPWGRLSIIAWGDCFDPPVLVCHGRVDSAASFRPLINLLPRNFYYIGLDLPGNGKSDPMPPGLMIDSYDLVYALKVVATHFRWDTFVYMAHSLGTLLGKLYNLSYPDQMSHVIELDPVPAFFTVQPDEFAAWYQLYYASYYVKYEKYNASKDTAPLYTRDKAITMLKRKRGLSDEAAAIVLDRLSEPVGGDLIRFTYDQRFKTVTTPPFTAEQKERLFTTISTPTLVLAASYSVKYGYYDKTPFALNESAYPAGNYRVREVSGHHDVHLVHPERLAGYIGAFLVDGLKGLDAKAKL